MQHIYLCETAINDALANRAITAQEAEKLMLKITMQAAIYKSISK
jgi:hypothetical protein